MICVGFFWRQIFFVSPGSWLISDVIFEDLSFALSFKLIGELHGGLPKIETVFPASKYPSLPSLPVKLHQIMNISATTSNFGNLFEIWLCYTGTHGMSKCECQSHSRVFFDRHIIIHRPICTENGP